MNIEHEYVVGWKKYASFFVQLIQYRMENLCFSKNDRQKTNEQQNLDY